MEPPPQITDSLIKREDPVKELQLPSGHRLKATPRLEDSVLQVQVCFVRVMVRGCASASPSEPSSPPLGGASVFC